ncbi:hypothetical protein [Chitinophaga sp.]|uniref:hypothetical protein n=1 Tax=Chitinophaga sp. TaxID=1869181 RepID=UPI0031E45332
MEQPTIFDESFGDSLPVRRRALLSIILKIYIWVGLIFYSLVLMATLVKGTSLLIKYPSTLENTQWVMQTIVSVLSSCIIILMTASLWFEQKWAIRCNWICGGVYGLLLFIALFTGRMGYAAVIVALCSIPFWCLLYKIQDQWENEAVSGRE